MLDLVQAQKDVTATLLSAASLANVAIVSYREKRLANELDYRTTLEAGRNGKAGVMAVVMLPSADAGEKNVTGPVLDWLFPVIVIELDAVNMEPQGGSLLSAEEVSQRVMDVLHHEADEKYGTWKVSGKPMAPETQFNFPGCIAYRTTFVLYCGRSEQTRRCAPVQVDLTTTPGQCALSCATPGAEVYYTLDGSSPGNASGGNPNSQLYAGPFPVAAGDTVRAAAYADGFNKSTSRHVPVT